jgi:hypothetical protein
MSKIVGNIDNVNDISEEKGVANGYATLDANSKLTQSELPTGILEYADFVSFPGTGTESFLYLDKSINKLYRWNVDTVEYIEIKTYTSSSLASSWVNF